MERAQFIFFITDGYKESFSILTKGKEKKSPPGSSIHGLFQARVLEWGAMNVTDLYESLLTYIP